jgi:hypothetical protein
LILSASSHDLLQPCSLEKNLRRPILDGDFTWNFYIYGRTTGLRPQAASDLVEEIIRFREVD